MRSLSATLLAAQKEASHVPYVKVEAKNKIAGIVRLDWTRLYTGSEDDYFHTLTMPDDGSLIRVRITPPSDSRKLYWQRVANPSPESDFSQWTYSNQYNAVIVTCCSLGAEVSIFWIKSDQAIYRVKSTDCGATFGSPELIDYSPTTAIYGIAAAYKPNGDLALFFADQATLYVKKYVNSSWQDKAAWDKTTGDLSGTAAVYDGDWNLLITGKDANNNIKLWSLIYGDGGEVTADIWSDLEEFASAPSDGDFEYLRVFMDKPDVYRCFFIEKFGGTQAYDRPFWSYSVPGANYSDNLWHEPVPLDLSSEYGLAIAHHGDYCWLSNPNGVWRAKLTEESLDVTTDVLSIRHELDKEEGRLIMELDNSEGQYASPGEGQLKSIDIGCQLEISPGYATPLGNEVSSGLAFSIDGYEHTSSGGKASLILYASDGWNLIKNWRARHQFRWNKTGDDMCVKDLLAFVLARAGLKLEVESQSSVITDYYPDFTIHPDNRGDIILRKLLSFIPDIIFIEGNKAYIVNPSSSDSSVYSYGSSHFIVEGKYQRRGWELNRIQVEGYDPVGDEPVIVDSFSWTEITKLYDRLSRLEDRNIDTVSKAEQRGEAYLRQAEIESVGGATRIAPNCGQQLYDVIDITDSRAGLSEEKKRVMGLTLAYDPQHGKYEQRLSLGAV